MKIQFTENQKMKLKHYVYIYLDPTTNEIFYVGKGKGDRVFSHLKDTSECEKVQKIEEIRSQGYEPVIEILVHGLEDDETAHKVEAAVIDLVGLNNLTNIKRGHHSLTYGRVSLDQLMQRYDSQEAEIKEPSILIRINKLFRYGLSPQELYDYTRGCWKVGEARNQVKLAFSVYDNIIQEVYEVAHWFPGGTTYMGDRTTDRLDRWEFVGKPASEEIRNRYRFKSVSSYIKRGNQNPVMYVNINT